jgi:hypothetical protein
VHYDLHCTIICILQQSVTCHPVAATIASDERTTNGLTSRSQGRGVAVDQIFRSVALAPRLDGVARTPKTRGHPTRMSRLYEPRALRAAASRVRPRLSVYRFT